MSAEEVSPWPSATRWLVPVAGLVLAGVVLYTAAVAWSGSEQTLAAIADIGWSMFAAGTVVASSTYLVRHARWHAMLRRLGHAVPWRYDLRVYVAGIALSPTPAKVGETLRSVLLLPRGVPVSDSLAMFFGDRLSDVIGVALLGAAVGACADRPQIALAFIGAAALAAAGLCAHAVRRGAVARWRSAGRLGQWLQLAAAPARAWAAFWTTPRAVAYAGAAVVAFGVQALVFAAYVQSVAPQVGVMVCMAIFTSSTLIGAASMMPGGLGAMEAALALQLTQSGVTWPQALAAVLAIRASTLWFGTLLGVVAMGTLTASVRRGQAE